MTLDEVRAGGKAGLARALAEKLETEPNKNHYPTAKHLIDAILTGVA